MQRSALDAEGRLALDLSTERLNGYKEGLGTAWDEQAVRTCRPNATAPARRAAFDLLESENRPTAILAMSDVLALGALQAAAELGIAVPAELSVVGFDDSPAATLATPALTSVAQPHEEKGRLAAEWLTRAIERGRPLRGRLALARFPTGRRRYLVQCKVLNDRKGATTAALTPYTLRSGRRC